MEGPRPHAVELPLPGLFPQQKGQRLVLLHQGVGLPGPRPDPLLHRLIRVGGKGDAGPLLGDKEELPAAVLALGLGEHGVVEKDAGPPVLKPLYAQVRPHGGIFFGPLPVRLLPPGKRLGGNRLQRRLGRAAPLPASGAAPGHQGQGHQQC